MPKRIWKSWPTRAYKSLNDAGGLLGIGGIVVSVVGVAAAVPVVVGVGIASVAATAIYALAKGFPPKLKNPNELIGVKIPILDFVNFTEDFTKLGIIGPSSSGKSTFLNHATTLKSENSRTNIVTGTILTLQTNPPKLIGLIDGDGREFAQQFEVIKPSDIIFIFLDHNIHENSKDIIKGRLQENENFLNQFEGYLKINKDKLHLSHIHFVLNKRDLWQNSPQKAQLMEWFSKIVNSWKHKNFASDISSSIHSNVLAVDITNLMQVIISSKSHG